MINHNTKCLFIHIPRCAGSSMEKILTNNDYILNGHYHIRYQEHLNHNKQIKDYFKFTFVRNPYDKLVSEYFWFKDQYNKWNDANTKKLYRDKTFKEFVTIFLSDEARGDHYHRFTYHQMLEPVSDISFIGRYENLSEDFDIVCNTIGISQQTLTHVYKTRHDHYSEYYDNETRELVACRYARDIERFKYKFED